MKKFITFSLVFIMSFFAYSSQTSKNVAIVKMVRGKALTLAPNGEKNPIKKGMWLKEGAIIKTDKRAFVRLSFIDKSSMNIGPASELKIEKFSKKDAGVINVLTGKIRSQVTKDYLNMDKDKSKLYVKSKNAVMGVRGTDFLFSTNKKTGATTTVLFEGSIVFNKIGAKDNRKDLETIVKKGRFIKPGEVSVAMKSKPKPTVPAKLNSKQFSKLMKNADFKVAKAQKMKKVKSKVPPGLSGRVVAGDADTLKQEIQKVVKVKVNTNIPEPDKANIEATKGFVKGDDVRPADGTMVHIDSGIIIPPSSDAVFDRNAGEWVSNTSGDINAAGEYIPPQDFNISDEGKLLKVDGDKIKEVVIDIKPVDQMPPIENAPTIRYEGPKEPINGPTPAGTIENLKDAFNDDVKVLEDGSIVNPDGTVLKTDGTLILDDGTKITADGTEIRIDGTKIDSDGNVFMNDGQVITADGQVLTGDDGRDLASNFDKNSSGEDILEQVQNCIGCGVDGIPTTVTDSIDQQIENRTPPPSPGKTRVNVQIEKN